MNKRVCIIQMHYTDITEYLFSYNSVEKILSSNIFDDVVIAAADIPKNECLKDYKKKWDIEIRFGSIKNVTNRIKEIVDEFSAKTVLRILPQWFFIDTNLILKMVDFLEKNEGDYILLPRDFDIRFGGDIFSNNFINTLDKIFNKKKFQSKDYMFNPWGYAEKNMRDLELNIIHFKDVPTYDNQKFKKFKLIYNQIWPDKWDTGNSPQFPYQMAKKYINQNETKVLDIACGFGAGSKNLVDNGARSVIGVDISEDVINHCNYNYRNIDNLSFLKGDAFKIDLDKSSFDLIVSIHTMEHIHDDDLFLQNLKSWMKKKAKIVLEVPLLMRYPFKYSNEPYSNAHIREYNTEDLITLFSSYFKILESYGVCRGHYVDLDRARNAVLLIGENSF